MYFENWISDSKEKFNFFTLFTIFLIIFVKDYLKIRVFTPNKLLNQRMVQINWYKSIGSINFLSLNKDLKTIEDRFLFSE